MITWAFNSDETTKEAAAEGLAAEIKRLATLLSAESFGKLMHDLNRRLFEMVHDPDPRERQAAVITIGEANLT